MLCAQRSNWQKFESGSEDFATTIKTKHPAYLPTALANIGNSMEWTTLSSTVGLTTAEQAINLDEFQDYHLNIYELQTRKADRIAKDTENTRVPASDTDVERLKRAALEEIASYNGLEFALRTLP